jgi:tryptophan 2,3-dioxygenase
MEAWPMSVPSTPATPDTPAGLTSYERYLRIDDLLALQKPPTERLHPDELVFQITHQTFELWWKLTLELFAAATDALRAGDFDGAANAVRRSVAAQEVVRAAMRQLELVPPADFLVLRAGLGDGNGGDSPGFRGILRATPDLWAAFAAALDREGVALVDLYASPRAWPAIYACAEALTDFDEQFHLFRAAHLKLAQRHLGLHSTGTGGMPVAAMERTLRHLLFPALWQARDDLVARATAQAGE